MKNSWKKTAKKLRKFFFLNQFQIVPSYLASSCSTILDQAHIFMTLLNNLVLSWISQNVVVLGLSQSKVMEEKPWKGVAPSLGVPRVKNESRSKSKKCTCKSLLKIILKIIKSENQTKCVFMIVLNTAYLA